MKKWGDWLGGKKSREEGGRERGSCTEVDGPIVEHSLSVRVVRITRIAVQGGKEVSERKREREEINHFFFHLVLFHLFC